MGDFNAHNKLWGGTTSDTRGRVIEEFITVQELCLLNDGQFTYTHPDCGISTATDLSIGHPSVLFYYSWHCHEDTCGGDHYPLILLEMFTGAFT